jgi:hypothetical protein
MTVLLVQFGRAFAAFETPSQYELSDPDRARADVLATEQAPEPGYYDVLLVRDPRPAGAVVPSWLYRVALDHEIQVK